MSRNKSKLTPRKILSESVENKFKNFEIRMDHKTFLEVVEMTSLSNSSQTRRIVTKNGAHVLSKADQTELLYQSTAETKTNFAVVACPGQHHNKFLLSRYSLLIQSCTKQGLTVVISSSYEYNIELWLIG